MVNVNVNNQMLKVYGMSIKQKLYMLGFIATLGVITLVVTTSQFSKNTEQLNTATNLVAQLEIRLLNLRRNEKDFLLRKDMKYLDKFNNNMEIFLSLEKELSGILTSAKLLSKWPNLKAESLYATRKAFKLLVLAFQEHGLKDDQSLLGAYNSALEAYQSRLTGDQLLSVFAFDKQIHQGIFDRSLLTTSGSTPLLTAAETLVAQKVAIGLKYNEGALGDTRKLSHTVEEQFKTFSEALDGELNLRVATFDYWAGNNRRRYYFNYRFSLSNIPFNKFTSRETAVGHSKYRQNQ